MSSKGNKKRKEVAASPSSSDSEQDEAKNSSDAESEATAKVQLPMARVRKIIKSDPDVKKISHDAAQLIARSTELFIEFMVREGYQITKDDNRKTFQYKDLATCVQENEILDFLQDVIPQKMTKYEIEKRLQSKQQVEKSSRQPSPPQTSSTSTSSSSANGVEDGAARDDGEGGDAPVRKESARQDDKAAATEGKEEKDTHDAEPEKKSNGDAMEE